MTLAARPLDRTVELQFLVASVLTLPSLALNQLSYPPALHTLQALAQSIPITQQVLSLALAQPFDLTKVFVVLASGILLLAQKLTLLLLLVDLSENKATIYK